MILSGKKTWEIRSRPVPPAYLSKDGVAVDISIIPCKLGRLAPKARSPPVKGCVNFCGSHPACRQELLSDDGLVKHGLPKDLIELMCDSTDDSGTQLWIWEIGAVRLYSPVEEAVASSSSLIQKQIQLSLLVNQSQRDGVW
jgi:hypothetical protein